MTFGLNAFYGCVKNAGHLFSPLLNPCLALPRRAKPRLALPGQAWHCNAAPRNFY
jgi:hypothetical protein